MVAKRQSQVHQNINRRDGKSTKKEVASWIMIVGVKSMMYVCRMQLKGVSPKTQLQAYPLKHTIS